MYAVRRETNGKAVYFPAYDLEWEEYQRHKAAGGTLEDVANKKPSPLTDNKLVHHLEGKDTIGIYPLLRAFTHYQVGPGKYGSHCRGC
ncbi:TOTE conflict system archaeo-eukaryotic primase domain-containing protein [Flavitalea sp. BT771]|uniref:TOTE conflict system archaeo-eukaryotic primase domain-containing protein n=1 Tax=Flavitalea sp. BT771 TaxID=3063329 RepID=UPI003982B60E